jgi:thiol-disulfide isomerase/thioredoxin
MKRIGIILMMALVNMLKANCQTDTSVSVIAQVEGIAFENNLTWQQVLRKAKEENKYIFVDCYASWCAPCKWMDQYVYANDTVGDFMNRAFVALKVQMDTTQQDSTEVRDWYVMAHEIGEQYRIRNLPTYLFFTSDGHAVHKAIGRVNIPDFLTLAKGAMDPHEQYYTLLDQYRQGTLQYSFMPNFANAAKRLHEDSLSSAVAIDYLRYLGEQPEKDLWTKDNLRFIESYDKVIHYGDRIFQRYFHDRMRIDSIMGSEGYADGQINQVAYNEEIRPRIDAGIKDRLEPDWRFMERSIKRKYGIAFVQVNVLMGQEVYYRSIGKWDKYVKYFVLEMQITHIENWPPGRGTSFALNNNAFEVFKYSKQKKELEAALSWLNRALTMNAYQGEELDTKANLLYKLGRASEAITYEERAHSLAPDDKNIEESYDKMKIGQPTW